MNSFRAINVPVEFRDRVHSGVYTAMYWIRAGLPILPGTSVSELTTALFASFRHDLLDHHKEFTKRESLREEPSTFTALASVTFRNRSKRSTLTQSLPPDPALKPEFATWATKILDDSEAYITGLAKCQSDSAYQSAVMNDFANRLDAFRRAEKLASLPKDATIEDKIDAGYYAGHEDWFRKDVLMDAGNLSSSRNQKIFDKANELRGDEGMSAVLDEFHELLDLVK